MGGMIVIYELNLALDGITVKDGKVDISDAGDANLREALGGVQDLILVERFDIEPFSDFSAK